MTAQSATKADQTGLCEAVSQRMRKGEGELERERERARERESEDRKHEGKHRQFIIKYVTK